MQTPAENNVDDDEVTAKAIEMAKLLAAKTNSSWGGGGGGQYRFPPQSNYGGGFTNFSTGSQGVNFSAPIHSIQPPSIPQLPPPTTSSSGDLNSEQNRGGGQPNFPRFPPPNFFARMPPPNFLPNPNYMPLGVRPPGPQGGGGQKPIRFNILKPKPVQNHVFTPPSNFLNSEQTNQQQQQGPPGNYFNNNNNTEGSQQQQQLSQNNNNNFNSNNQGQRSGQFQNGMGVKTAPQPGDGLQLIQRKQQESMDASVWPESLKDYVRRCFDMSKTNIDKDQIEIILKGKITRAANQGVLASKDWSLEPLPEISNGRVQMLPFGGTGKSNKEESAPHSSTSSFDRGRGKRGGRGRGSRDDYNDREEKQGKGKKNRSGGNRGRSATFRGRSRSSSNSRSGSPSPTRRPDSFSKRRRRSSSDVEDEPITEGFNKKGKKNKQLKAGKGKNKKKWQNQSSEQGADASTPHIYSQFGKMNVESNPIALNARAARFANQNNTQKKPSMKSRLGFVPASNSPQPVEWDIDTTPSSAVLANLSKRLMMAKIVGTCTDLEKKYLRLTCAPDPSTIRPPHILRASLKHVQAKWLENEDYYFACDQLKSIRQDLTVQQIRDAFTVKVYETHARIALEKQDHEEYNQCQSQLVQLYSSLPESDCKNRIEFTAYRILYCIFTANTLDLGNLLTFLSDEDKENECIQHALNLRTAWSLKNYARFFKLHAEAPKMSGYLIDWFANRERKNALKTILKAYRPSVSVSFVKSQLGFSDSDQSWTEFLTATQWEPAIIYSDPQKQTIINAKDSYPLLLSLTSSS